MSGLSSSKLLATLARGGLYAASDVGVVAAESVVGMLLVGGYKWWDDYDDFRDKWRKGSMTDRIHEVSEGFAVPAILSGATTAIGFHAGCVAALQKAVQHYAGLH